MLAAGVQDGALYSKAATHCPWFIALSCSFINVMTCDFLCLCALAPFW